MLKTSLIKKVITILDAVYPTLPMHEVHGHDPFHLLIAIILSQRSRDSVTVPIAKQLFAVAGTPQSLSHLPLSQLESIIRPIGFYHEKAKAIHAVSTLLVKKFKSKVPSSEAELLSLPKVGRKTANIILTTFFNTPQIAVDVHVHRIANRLGVITTTSPFETEVALTKLIPKNLHARVNQIFVAHGQTICLPRVPRCSKCPVYEYCLQKNVQACV